MWESLSLSPSLSGEVDEAAVIWGAEISRRRGEGCQGELGVAVICLLWMQTDGVRRSEAGVRRSASKSRPGTLTDMVAMCVYGN
jgi:hypothetical protein